MFHARLDPRQAHLSEGQQAEPSTTLHSAAELQIYTYAKHLQRWICTVNMLYNRREGLRISFRSRG